MQRQRAVLVFALLLASGLAGTALWQPVAAQTSERCFVETGLCISGRMREFWEQNGGLPVFGLPITPQREETIEGRTLQVQWFERNRLELHPENSRPYDVLLGRLGVDRLTQQGRDWQTFPKSPAQTGCRFFPETGQNVCEPILSAWRANGIEIDGASGKSEAENLSLFGLPISPAQPETLSDGQQYIVQWFERARFEIHPQNRPPFDVLLGLLGTEVRAGGGAPPQPPQQPQPTAPPAVVEPPSRVDFEFPSRRMCDDLNESRVFRPERGGEVSIGSYDIPAEVPICLRGFMPNIEVQIEVTKPDGDRDRESVFPNADGKGEWFYARLTGNVLGEYEVRVRQNNIRLEGSFDLKRTPESEPKVLVRPRIAEPGREIRVDVGGLPANSEVVLHLYRRCETDQGCYVYSTPPLKTNELGQVRTDIDTSGGDPEDVYQIGFFRDIRNADSFIYDVFELVD